MSLLARYARLRERSAREDGVVALMTLLFFALAGMTLILLIWAISISTGAYNALYSATQSAAYAAANVVEQQSPAEGAALGSGQLPWSCSPAVGTTESSNFQCRASGGGRGNTFVAAHYSLMASLGADAQGRSQPGNFGLSYPGTVSLADENGNALPMSDPWILAYQIDQSPGLAANRCYPSSNDAVGFSTTSGAGGPGSPDRRISCWRFFEDGVWFPWHYESGVVVRTVADLNLIPGCSAGNEWICPATQLQATAAATQSQPLPPASYNTYFCYPVNSDQGSAVTPTDCNASGSTVGPPPPGLTLTSNPASGTLASNNNSVTFTWTTTGYVDSVTCSVDGGAAFACSSGISRTFSAGATHTFAVTASNSGGDTTKQLSFTIQTQPAGAPDSISAWGSYTNCPCWTGTTPTWQIRGGTPQENWCAFENSAGTFSSVFSCSSGAWMDYAAAYGGSPGSSRWPYCGWMGLWVGAWNSGNGYNAQGNKVIQWGSPYQWYQNCS